MDINTERYFDSIGVDKDPKTFLNKWYKWGIHKFFEAYKNEYDDYYLLTSYYYDRETARGIHPIDVVASDSYKTIKKKFDPVNTHNIMYFLLVKIPRGIVDWLCCGWKLKYVPSNGVCKGHWTWIDRYHMVTKLCRYGSPMWPEYKFTWWDKLRFKWITGYKYEEVK